ncbi:uncharacterized protein LOC105214491 [Zeugodacus cucurbitae]|uniref:uncharacterized protein LOC105214491 n=1 Tax=Zeugodacus cucurbitae TaxID=28588 RepID=UPI0005969F72|nr:uncharacterized protein LOC105214491 [Zeugodacus cucurbitae]
MNTTSESVKNLLFLTKNQKYDDELYGCLLKLIPLGKTVLVITRSSASPELLPLMEKAGMKVHKNKQSLQRLFFICCDNIEGVIKILFDLHKWANKPHIIVLDLHAFGCWENEQNKYFAHEGYKAFSRGSLLKRFMLCFAVLFNNMNILNKVLADTVVDGDKKSLNIFSIVVLPKSSTLLTASDVDLIIDMYYCNNTYEEFADIFQLINSTATSDQAPD